MELRCAFFLCAGEGRSICFPSKEMDTPGKSGLLRDKFSGSSESNSTCSPCKMACFVFWETWVTREFWWRLELGCCEANAWVRSLATKFGSVICGRVDWEKSEAGGCCGYKWSAGQEGWIDLSFLSRIVAIRLARASGFDARFCCGGMHPGWRSSWLVLGSTTSPR